MRDNRLTAVPDDWFDDPVLRGVAGLEAPEAAEDGFDWQAEALCAQTDPEAFFPEKGGSTGTRSGSASPAPCAPSALSMLLRMMSDSAYGVVSASGSGGSCAAAPSEGGSRR